MTTFEVVLVARTPSATGAPALAEVDRLTVDTISYTEELNKPGTATVSCPVRALTASAKTRLADLALHPCEVWIYQDSAKVWAGGIETIQIQGQTANLNCTGLLGYLWRMGVVDDLTYAAADQFTIVKALVERWQVTRVANWANFGIVTSGIGTSGELRDRTYLASELATVGQRISELSAVDFGFDMRVDPTSRALILSYPTFGTNLSSTIVLDERNIDSASIIQSVAPQDFAVTVTGTATSQSASGEGQSLRSGFFTSAAAQAFGYSWAGLNFDGVSVQATLDDYVVGYLHSHNHQFFQPGVTVMTRPGAQIGSFHPGDSVAYAYDAGLGFQSGTFRVAKVTVSVQANGEQRMAVEFL